MPVSEVEVPKKRTRKQVAEVEMDTSSRPERTPEQRVDDLIDEVREHRASVDVCTEDMGRRLEDVERLVALLKTEASKDASGAFTKLNDSILRLTERAELRDQRFDALLAVLAFCDRVPRKRFDTLLAELRTLAEKPDQAAAVTTTKPLPGWQLVTIWLVGGVVAVLAFVGLLTVLG